MPVKKPLVYTLTSAAALLLLTACSSAAPRPLRYMASLQAGHSQVALSWTLAEPTARFQIHNSQAGRAAGSAANIERYRAFLVASSTPPSGSVTPWGGQVVSVEANGNGSQSLIFADVPAGSYYACVAAFDDAVTFDPEHNLTATGTVSYAEGPVSCSNSGGESGAPGRMTVDGTYSVSTPAALGLTLSLRPAQGARIESTVTVFNGIL